MRLRETLPSFAASPTVTNSDAYPASAMADLSVMLQSGCSQVPKTHCMSVPGRTTIGKVLSRLFRRRTYDLSPVNVRASWADGNECYEWPPPRNVLVGESYRQPALKKLAGPPCDPGYLIPVEVCFVRESENEHDANAFRAEVNGRHVGYLRREVARQVAAALDQAGCGRFSVCGVIRGGSSGAPSLGVHVWLERRLSPGPELSFADDTWVVPWPPGAEIAYCSADDQ
jgi:hypothetical protein